jgi:hypothetical protein
VATLLVLPLVLQAMPFSIQQHLRHLLLTQIGNSMTAFQRPGLFAWSAWPSFALLCTYAAVAIAVGAVLFVRRDA